MTDTAVRSRRLLDGRYELHALIGQGTFGRVFSGYDQRLARPVAVKVIKPWWTEEPQWAERFEREAQLMARVSAPGIVQVYDIGYAEEGVYYVAELVDGESLADRLSRGALSPAEAVDIAHQLCSALAHAHAQHIVHRDIKPGNVLITREGRVKVGDFGVARLAEGTGDGPGTILGTPRYMAPEQARGRTPTPATDVYGAGVVLYEMLAGRPPFLERSAVELALRHIGDPPPPLPEHVPPALVEVVDRALAKEPGDRYPGAAEMATALEAAGAEAADSPPPAPSVRPRRENPATRVAPRRGPLRRFNPSESRRYRALLACVLLLLFGLILGAVLTANGSVRVPSLRGLDRAAVRSRLTHLGLRTRFDRRYSAAPVGEVIAQRPAPGRHVSSGSTIALVLSAGPPPVRVPPLLGQQSVAAQTILSRLGLSARVSRVPAPGVAPGLVVQQSPSATAQVRPHSQISLAVAETPRWRPLTSFSGDGSGTSVPFGIRGTRWRLVYSMGYDGMCTFIFFCSGPTAHITNAATGAAVTQFGLGDGSGQTRVISSGPGEYRVSVTPGSDNAHWSIQVEDDY